MKPPSRIKVYSSSEHFCVQIALPLRALLAAGLGLWQFAFQMEFPNEDLLSEEFELRKAKNRKYSVRAFARDLRISAGFLSSIMNEKRKLSEEKALEIATTLKWSPAKARLFKTMARLRLANSDLARAEILRELENMNLANLRPAWKITLDRFRIIADWYHIALLELTELQDYDTTEDGMAQRLGVPARLIREALRRLVGVGLLEFREDRWRKTKQRYCSGGDAPSSAIRSFHRQILGKAIEALETQNLDKRDFGCLALSIDDEMVPEIKRRLSEFRKEILDLTEKSKTKNAVYALSLQLFRMDNSPENANENALKNAPKKGQERGSEYDN